ncbi:hypothetical protein [Aeromicrobium sp. UC242_57]|uniref:hypothetical protein n=1 Tax=Aeromicrobium sp. UC242_57 TaxID=3374624 RepID=UPI0037B77531
MSLIGRAEQSARLRAALADPDISLVLVVGEAGVGKTHLLADATADRAAVRAWGDAAMSHVPLAALAHLVERTSGTLAELIAQAAQAVPVGGVLMIDDIDRCDDLLLRRGDAAGPVEALHRRCDRPLHDEALPERVEAVAHDPGTALIRLPAFSRVETDALAAALLGDAVDAALSDGLWRRSGGNALFIGQLIGEARALAAIRHTMAGWVMTRPLSVPTRLRQMLLARLESVDDVAASAARFLAGVGRIGAAQIERAGHAAGVDALVAAEVAAFDGDVARFAHPLYAEVIWEALTALQRRAVLRDHVRLERESDAPDLVRLAVLALDAGDVPDPDGLLAAARLANAGGAAEQARRLAHAAIDVGGTRLLAEAATVAAGAEAELGLAAEAVETLTSALAAVEPGPSAVVLAITLHEVNLWARFDRASAVEVLRTQARRYPRTRRSSPPRLRWPRPTG